MLCSLCGKNIIKYEITPRSVTGESKVFYLCDVCFKSGDFLRREGIHVRVLPTCPVCGYTAEEYRKSGLLGCDHCYKALYDEALPYIERVQGGKVHTGKKLSKTEKYEAAAELKAYMKKLFTAEGDGELDLELIYKYRCKIAELKEYLFGYDESEGE